MFFFFLMLMYKLQSTEDSSTWLVVRIRSAEDGHSSPCSTERKFHGSESSLYGLFAPGNESAEERKSAEERTSQLPIIAADELSATVTVVSEYQQK